MKSLLAYVLAALVLLQTFRREVLVVDYAPNQAALTARFCVNKALQPLLRCNGRCYLAKQLKQQERDGKLPNLLRQQWDMLPVVVGSLVPPCLAAGPDTAARYCRVPTLALSELNLVFVRISANCQLLYARPTPV
ncbi:hypothetical protein [Hymenobacter terrenus]|uniref:hypothetical protein n=1 Tax=Hymenobacter terrenus TaxID=1629124 RepID=UPI0006976B83|nr:hypothetical protein [Hymenobacter terrenus]